MTNKRRNAFCLFILAVTFLASINCIGQVKKQFLNNVDPVLSQSVQQYHYLMQHLPEGKLPRTFENDQLKTVDRTAWTSGFYPGSLLYLYSFSKDTSLKNEALRRLHLLEPLQWETNTHDLGFMMYCSYGNAFLQNPDNTYKSILVQSAKSLASRFNAKVGCIKSWNQIKSLDGKNIWTYPVIIDNMMNLELLFFATRVTGDSSFSNIAIKHAETTLKNHLRSDYSSYHVVCYDPETGKVLARETQQGFAHNSTWARGQAWGIYGFTMVYRETRDKRFLKAAQGMADYFLNHLPKDPIPYWDFNVNQPGYNPPFRYDPLQYPSVPKDASAAAIASSALIELSGYVSAEKSEKYLRAAQNILTALMSPVYRAKTGENGGFLLKHSVGGFPGNAEVDVPLIYADYYFIEALMRYRKRSKH